MKYKAGDKFIIEIWNEVKPQGLYTIKGFNTLVFDDYGLGRLEQVHEHNGCWGCEYETKAVDDEHCSQCCYNYGLQWTPKKNDIQVGDEVEKFGEGKGIVVDKDYDGKMYLRVLKNQKRYALWAEEACTRTGKTYPELIKALEELQKEGE